jgi:hypothetical protein
LACHELLLEEDELRHLVHTQTSTCTGVSGTRGGMTTGAQRRAGSRGGARGHESRGGHRVLLRSIGLLLTPLGSVPLRWYRRLWRWRIGRLVGWVAVRLRVQLRGGLVPPWHLRRGVRSRLRGRLRLRVQRWRRLPRERARPRRLLRWLHVLHVPLWRRVCGPRWDRAGRLIEAATPALETASARRRGRRQGGSRPTGSHGQGLLHRRPGLLLRGRLGRRQLRHGVEAGNQVRGRAAWCESPPRRFGGPMRADDAPQARACCRGLGR